MVRVLEQVTPRFDIRPRMDVLVEQTRDAQDMFQRGELIRSKGVSWDTDPYSASITCRSYQLTSCLPSEIASLEMFDMQEHVLGGRLT